MSLSFPLLLNLLVCLFKGRNPNNCNTHTYGNKLPPDLLFTLYHVSHLISVLVTLCTLNPYKNTWYQSHFDSWLTLYSSSHSLLSIKSSGLLFLTILPRNLLLSSGPFSVSSLITLFPHQFLSFYSHLPQQRTAYLSNTSYGDHQTSSPTGRSQRRS